MGYQSNTAYDLSLFEGRRTYVRPTPPPKAEAGTAHRGKSAGKQAGTRTKAPTAEQKAEARKLRETRQARVRLAQILALCVIAVIAVTVLVSSRVDYHELTMEIEAASRELTDLEQEYEALRLEFDNKMSDTAVEEYAVSQLGMQKRENSQTEYISLDVSNVFEIDGKQSNDWYQTNLEKILSYGD